MSKVAVVYWSGTGNTEAMAEEIAAGARNAGADVDVFQAADFTPERLQDYDAVAFGCPAMGDEVLEEAEFEPMYDEVEPELDERKVVLFGSYDWGDGEWMESWQERAEGAGVNVLDTLIVNLEPDDDAKAECRRIGALLA